jgi:tRNA pseudouridine13 synthase
MKFNYKIKQKKEDFVVDEISLQPDFYPSEESDFSYLWVEKRGMTTFDAMHEMKKVFNLNHEDIANQGLKDEDGVTSQLISVRKIISEGDLELFNKKFTADDYRIRIKNIAGYGKKPLAPRFLHGNNFKLVIRNLSKSTAKSFYDYCQKNRFISFINYYDNQRFGIAGGPYNTHLIGKAIVNNDWVQAFKEFEKSKNNELGGMERPEKADNVNCRNFFKKINSSKLSFFVSSYSSHLWNKGASGCINGGKIKTCKYDFPEVGCLSLPRENVFKLSNLFTADAYDMNKKTYRGFQSPQTRNLFVTTTVFPMSIEKDGLNKNKYSVQVSFFLPTGCYATMLIKQIFIQLNNASPKK